METETRVGAFCSSCGAEVHGELHTLRECVAFLTGRLQTVERELSHVHWVLTEMRRSGWNGSSCYVIDDAEKWLDANRHLVPLETKGRRVP